jgi:hypothetical protein
MCVNKRILKHAWILVFILTNERLDQFFLKLIYLRGQISP